VWQYPRRQVQHESTGIDLTRWVGWIGLAVAVGIVYFVAARLSLALLTKPEGVAVFWPAAGVSAGVLIALGSRARWPVVVGTMAATIAANLFGDRNLWSAVLFALCNAGEAVLAVRISDWTSCATCWDWQRQRSLGPLSLGSAGP
jgi:integral membrane sensor domain MASE1